VSPQPGTYCLRTQAEASLKERGLSRQPRLRRDRLFVGSEAAVWVWGRAENPGPVGGRGDGRVVKAGRRPPAGEAVTPRVVWVDSGGVAPGRVEGRAKPGGRVGSGACTRCEADIYCLGITPEALRVGIRHLLPRVECRGNKDRPDPGPAPSRAVRADHGPPAGEALTARSVNAATLDEKARQGFLVATDGGRHQAEGPTQPADRCQAPIASGMAPSQELPDGRRRIVGPARERA
jgi:hypothetical protein